MPAVARVMWNQLTAARYIDMMECSSVSLRNTTNVYARYTRSTICNGVVQSSKSDCNVSDNDAPPLCATSCVSCCG